MYWYWLRIVNNAPVYYYSLKVRHWEHLFENGDGQGVFALPVLLITAAGTGCSSPVVGGEADLPVTAAPLHVRLPRFPIALLL